MQQQQRTRIKSRHVRETRVQKRWTELKADALEKMQQQQAQQLQQQQQQQQQQQATRVR